jgi:OPA family glycerol-3-phosphate transporter-like MFS transporter
MNKPSSPARKPAPGNRDGAGGVAVPLAHRPKRPFLFYRNATFVALLAGYMGYYLCRQNFSVAYAPMHRELGIDLVTFGSISSLGTFVYALGKFGSGPLADKRGGRAVFFIGLLGSAFASLLFGLAGMWGGAVCLFALWGANRCFQSLGWGSLVNILAQWFSKREYGTAMGVMSISYQFGAVVASLFAGALLSLGSGWRGLFVIPALTLVVVGLVIRPFVLGSPAEAGYPLLASEPSPDAAPAADAEPGTEEEAGYLARFSRVLANPMFLLMCGLSFILTFLRECFSLWMPAYFSQMGAAANVAAFQSAVFPLLGCAGTLLSGWYSDRILGGNRVPIITAMLGGLLVTLLGLTFSEQVAQFTQAHLGPAFGRGMVATTLVGFCGFFLFGPYSMVGGGVVALDFGGRATAATAAGLLDSAGYLAATLSGFGVARLVTASGWTFTFGAMAGLVAAAIVLCLPAFRSSPPAASPHR